MLSHSVMDRLIAAAAWNEPQSLAQALLIVEHQLKNIDWEELDQWVGFEGIADDKETIEYYKSINRKLPE